MECNIGVKHWNATLECNIFSIWTTQKVWRRKRLHIGMHHFQGDFLYVLYLNLCSLKLTLKCRTFICIDEISSVIYVTRVFALIDVQNFDELCMSASDIYFCLNKNNQLLDTNPKYRWITWSELLIDFSLIHTLQSSGCWIFLINLF